MNYFSPSGFLPLRIGTKLCLITKSLNYSSPLILLVCFSIFTVVKVQAQFTPMAVQPNNTVIQGLCELVEEHGWLYFKEETEINPYTFFEDYAPNLGLGTYDEMVIVKEWQSEGYDHIKYAQYHKSIPVKGGVYSIHIKDCHAELAHGKIVEQLDITLPATIDEPTALQNALDIVGAVTYAWENADWENDLKVEYENNNATYYPKGELLIYGESGLPMIGANYKLVYRFEIVSINPYGFKEVFINAHTGQVVKIKSTELNDSGDCTTLFNGSRPIETDHRWAQDDYILKDKSRGKGIWTKYYDEDEPAWGLMNNVTDDNNHWGTPDRSATSAHWAAEMAWDYYSDNWNWNGPDNGGNKLRILANWNRHGNAKYQKYGGQDAIWVGGDSTTQQGIGTLDIIGHEFTHGVCKHGGGLEGGGTDEQSALVESFCDIFGEVIEHYVLGAHDWIHGGETGGTIPKRNLLNPNSTSNPDRYISGTYWDLDGEPHINCGVQNRWFSILAEGGVLNGINLYNGIGFEKASKIAYISLADYIQEGANHADARSSAIAAAKAIYGMCSLEERFTTNAWKAVNVGAAYQGGCVHISGLGMVCPGGNLPQSWIAINQGYSITWNYPASWNCTVSGANNNVLTLNSLAWPPQFSQNVTITATDATGANDSHNIFVAIGGGCFDDPDPCPEVRYNSQSKTEFIRNDTKTSSMRFFPNPVSGKLRINVAKIENAYKIEILNMLGKSVALCTFEGTYFEIDTQMFEPGTYLLKIMQPNSQEVYTFIKN